MSNLKRFIVISIISLTGLFFSSMKAEAAINAPIIEEVKRGETNTISSPIITGTTDNGTDVLIYIDGTYRGNGVANVLLGSKYRFFFQEKTVLAEGTHSVMAIAKNKTTLELSAASASVSFIVPASVVPAPTPIPTPIPAPIPSPIPVNVPAPTLLSPNERTRTGDNREFIIGLTKSGTLVHVYIDGIYQGKTKVIYHSSGTGAFFFEPPKGLSRTSHTAYAIAEDTHGQRSSVSNTLSYKIELPMPAPTLIRTVVNKTTTPTKPLVTGLAKNNSEVLVFVDNKFDGAFVVQNHPSGTANFAYQPFDDLFKGKTHKIHTRSVDINGKESIRSNALYYTYPKPVAKAPIKPAAPKKISGTPKITEPAPAQPKATTTPNAPPADNKTGQKPEEKTNLDDLLNKGEISENVSTSSIIALIKDKLSLNLIIFLVFLVGVIGWIFWVNRELAKERKEREAGLAEENAEVKKETPYEKFDQYNQNKNL